MIAFASAAMALAAPPAEAPPPKLIEIYRSQFDAELPPVPSGFGRTISFAFSPDEKWIALVMGTSGPAPTAPVWHLASTLLLLPLSPSQSPRVQISLGMPAGDPHWSPDSGSLAVSAIPASPRDRDAGTAITKVFDLSGKLLWTGPPMGRIVGFIAPGRLLAQHARGKGKLPSGFDSIDVRTSAVTAWPASRAASRHWWLAAMNPDRHLLAVYPDEEASKTVIVDYATGKVLQSMKNPMHVPPWAYYAEHGKTLCSAGSPDAFLNHPTCRDVDTGKTIAELKGIDGGEPADASAGSSRMVVTKLNSLPSQSGGTLSYHGNVVWDFRSGAEIAAWTASGLEVRPSLLGVVPAAVTISSSGRYVAQQLGEEVRIYELP